MTLTDHERAACADYFRDTSAAWASERTDTQAWQTLARAVGGNETKATTIWLAWREERRSQRRATRGAE